MKTLIKLSHLLPTDPVQAFDTLQEHNLFDFLNVGLTADSDGHIVSVYRTPEEAIEGFFRDYNSMVKIPLPIRAEFTRADGTKEAKVIRSFYHLMRLCSLLSNNTLKNECKKYMIQHFRKA